MGRLEKHEQRPVERGKVDDLVRRHVVSVHLCPLLVGIELLVAQALHAQHPRRRAILRRIGIEIENEVRLADPPPNASIDVRDNKELKDELRDAERRVDVQLAEDAQKTQQAWQSQDANSACARAGEELKRNGGDDIGPEHAVVIAVKDLGIVQDQLIVIVEVRRAEVDDNVHEEQKVEGILHVALPIAPLLVHDHDIDRDEEDVVQDDR
mmetsp:Transcript_24483/g.65743  ORF Transcript_24483/g.65743 Transcript_24483/m.65743 type:complete len:210 (-) Transcript_24483:263-892(-)